MMPKVQPSVRASVSVSGGGAQSAASPAIARSQAAVSSASAAWSLLAPASPAGVASSLASAASSAAPSRILLRPAAMPAVVRLNAWRDGAALAAVYAGGKRAAEPALLAEGETMALPGGVELRLDQVMTRGVAVGARSLASITTVPMPPVCVALIVIGNARALPVIGCSISIVP